MGNRYKYSLISKTRDFNAFENDTKLRGYLYELEPYLQQATHVKSNIFTEPPQKHD